MTGNAWFVGTLKLVCTACDILTIWCCFIIAWRTIFFAITHPTAMDACNAITTLIFCLNAWWFTFNNICAILEMDKISKKKKHIKKIHNWVGKTLYKSTGTKKYIKKILIKLISIFNGLFIKKKKEFSSCCSRGFERISFVGKCERSKWNSLLFISVELYRIKFIYHIFL